MADRSDMLIQFLQVTSTEDPVVAQQYLEATDWNLQAAIDHHFQGTVPRKPADIAAAGAGGGAGRGGSSAGGYDEEGVRAAIDARVERLVDHDHGAGMGAGGAGMGGRGLASARVPMPRVHAAFRDFEAERGA